MSQTTAPGKNDFSQGSLFNHIMRMALPMMVAQAVNILYNLTDRFFLGRIPAVGDDVLAGVGLVFPVMVIYTAVANMFGLGGGTLCSMDRGRGDLDHAGDIQANAFAMLVLSGFGEPLGAFVAAYVAIELGLLVSGKTKVDIIVTPLVSILSGSAVGLLIGPSISGFMTWLGSIVNYNVEQNPVLGGIIVSVLMGMILTLPISSAAIGISLNLSGLAAGAATVGCCANMIGFAVASYRENKVGGLFAQGIGTSMLQVPNIVKKPVIWLPAILTSAVLGPVGTTLIVMKNNAVGSGMGTAGLVGQIMTYQVMAPEEGAVVTLIKISVMHVVLPAVLSLGISEVMRKKGWIKAGDMKLDV